MTLAPSTITANARFFDNDLARVPKQALTVGVVTIMEAREVVIIATGAGKARAVKEGVEGGISSSWTISKLQEHESWVLVVDEGATGELKGSTVQVC